jgi:hypothetical protein
MEARSLLSEGSAEPLECAEEEVADRALRPTQSLRDLAYLETFESREADHLLVLGTQRVEGTREAVKPLLAPQASFGRRLVASEIAGEVHRCIDRSRRRTSQVADQKIGNRGGPAKERTFALPLEALDRLIGTQQGLLHHVIDFVSRPKLLAQAGTYERGETRSAFAGEPIEGRAITGLGLLNEVVLEFP